MKICYVCKEEKALAEFGSNKSRPDGLNRKCKKCYAAYMRGWYAKNADIHKSRVSLSAPNRRLRKYGLTTEELNLMEQKYDGLCHLCKARPGVSIDHNHDTGRVRGLLCQGCNSALGVLGDSVEGLQRAIKYLAGG